MSINPVVLDAGPGFTGHATDVATGLTYMQQRYYDPEIGRFISPDPQLPDANTGANINRYWYADNNPVRFTDPDGRLSRETGPLKTCHDTNSCVSNAQADKGVAKDAKQLVGTVVATAVAGGGAAVAVTSGAVATVGAAVTDASIKAKVAIDTTTSIVLPKAGQAALRNATGAAIAIGAKANQIKTTVLSSAVVQSVVNNSNKIIDIADGFFNPSSNPIPSNLPSAAGSSAKLLMDEISDKP